jgi:membrane-associated protein
MSSLRFAVYNIAGAVLWVLSLCLTGYYLGKTYPQIIDYVEYIILAFIILTSFAVGKSLLSLRKKETGKSGDMAE